MPHARGLGVRCFCALPRGSRTHRIFNLIGGGLGLCHAERGGAAGADLPAGRERWRGETRSARERETGRRERRRGTQEKREKKGEEREKRERAEKEGGRVEGRAAPLARLHLTTQTSLLILAPGFEWPAGGASGTPPAAGGLRSM
eukprot:scaffold96638_cov30-Tisochrysis_lutea.AAC.1